MEAGEVWIAISIIIIAWFAIFTKGDKE